jgi:hypothetical protein
MYITTAISAVLVVVGVVALPKRSDVAETVSLWNGRHCSAAWGV